MYVCVANLKNKIASYFTSKKEYRQEWQGNCNSGHASYGKALASTENKGKELHKGKGRSRTGRHKHYVHWRKLGARSAVASQ